MYDPKVAGGEEANLFSQDPFFTNFRNSMTNKLKISGEYQLTFGDVQNMYYACAYQIGIDNITDQWCSFFDYQAATYFDYYEDLMTYYETVKKENLKLMFAY